jgi:hypothetical protein
MSQVYLTNKNKHEIKNSNNNEVTRWTKTTTIPSLKQRKNINNNHVWVGLDLGFHSLILWGWFGSIDSSSEVLNADWALWVICFVGCTTGGILERGVDAGTPGMAGGDGAEVVTCSILLGAHSAGWFVCFA